MNIDTTQTLTDISGMKANKLTPIEKGNTFTANANVINISVVNKSEQSSSVEVNRESLEAMAQKLQDFVGSLNRGLEFSVDEDSGRDVIKVIDKNSGDTVRQYPSEEVLDLVASLSDAAGTFVNVEA